LNCPKFDLIGTKKNAQWKACKVRVAHGTDTTATLST